MMNARWKWIACSAILVCGFTGVALAAISSVTTQFNLNSADSNGNPNSKIVGSGTGKLYKESITGILVGVGTALVPNKSGAAQTYTNQGLSVFDPFAKVNVKSTADLEVLSAPFYQYSAGILFVIYNPASVSR